MNQGRTELPEALADEPGVIITSIRYHRHSHAKPVLSGQPTRVGQVLYVCAAV